MTETVPQTSLATLVEQYPGPAGEVFMNLGAALNCVLPGSGTHERYQSIEEVGLALVVGRDLPGRSYNPFDPDTPTRVSFMTDNRLQHPGAWQPQAEDARRLQGVIPEGMGRFTAYALAKMNALTDSDAVSSCNPVREVIAPGKIGLAGGRRIFRSLEAVSGLWEVHDHLAGAIFVEETDRAITSDEAVKTVDTLAADIEQIFGNVQKLHNGTPAARLSRQEVTDLVAMADRKVMARYLAKRSSDISPSSH